MDIETIRKVCIVHSPSRKISSQQGSYICTYTSHVQGNVCSYFNFHGSCSNFYCHWCTYLHWLTPAEDSQVAPCRHGLGLQDGRPEIEKK